MTCIPAVPAWKPAPFSAGILGTVWRQSDDLLLCPVPAFARYCKGSCGRAEMEPMMACIMLTGLPPLGACSACNT